MSKTEIKAEEIPNCNFLGKALARLRIYRNKKISPDPLGRQEYLASPRAWELLEEYQCQIINGTLHVPTIKLDPTGKDANGLPTMVYQFVVVDEKGAERCSFMDLYSLMKGHVEAIRGYDGAGTEGLITLADVSIERTSEFRPFIRDDGHVRYRPNPGVRLQLVKKIKCVKQAGSVTLPSGAVDLELGEEGKPQFIYILFEKLRSGKSAYIATIHFEEDETAPAKWRAIIYNDLGPQGITIKSDPVPESAYLGESATLHLYRNRKFSINAETGKYVADPESDEHVRDIPCSVKGGTLYIPDIDIDVEKDGEGKPVYVYTAMLVDESGVERDALFSDQAFEGISHESAPSVLQMDNPPSPKRNPLKIYRSRDFYFYVNGGRKAYEPKPGSLEYVMDISYEEKDGSLIIPQWTIDIDDADIRQDEDDTPSVIYRGLIVFGGVERIAFTGHIAGVPPRLITYEGDLSKIIVGLFKRSPFRRRDTGDI